MRSKAEIEKTLAHMKADCTADPAVNAIWIAALEWVLGDEAHRQAYADWLREIHPPKNGITTPYEITVKLLMALERLR